jgi:pimeloyl-ACP methyl ester carboxylesterase
VPVNVTRSGPPEAQQVVFVHGAMDRSAGFAAVARRLDDMRVITYDRRGYARSLGVGPPFTIAAHVEDLLGLLDRPSVLIGHSLGGVIALAASVTRPDLVGAVGVYEAPLMWVDWWPKGTAGAATVDASAEDAAEVFMRRLVGDSTWERLPEATRAARRAEGPALQGEIGDGRSGPPFDLAAVTVPRLVAHGTNSRPHHIEGSRVLAAELACELVVFEGANHMAHSRRPTEFADFVRRVVSLA